MPLIQRRRGPFAVTNLITISFTYHFTAYKVVEKNPVKTSVYQTSTNPRDLFFFSLFYFER